MKLYDTKPDYVKLDDDVSFQILRTNPRLTSNTKLMYDGDKLYLESYSATPLLSTNTYKHNEVYKTSLYNNDIKKFLSGTASGAFEVGRNMDDTIVGDTFDNQFENMYWCGAESINSDAYTQELGFIAPLYLRKKLPNYFVIFKIDCPSNTNLNSDEYFDDTYDFKTDILDKAHIIKTFSLKEGTVIGDYIRNYVGQKEFKYDQSMYVNFGAHEVYFYGIDKSTGVLTQKVENMNDSLLGNDSTILHDDSWLTGGYKRNNLVFPYIINLEFLFDDNETGDYQFARYFGMYCNDLDLYDAEVTGIKDGMVNYTDDMFSGVIRDEAAFYYIKDKYNNMYSLGIDDSISGTYDEDDFMGYESSSTSAYCTKLSGNGYSTLVMKINKKLNSNDVITIQNNIVEEESTLYMFSPSNDYRNLGKTGFKDNYFACSGTIEETAQAMAKCIASRLDTDGCNWMNVYATEDKVVIKSLTYGADWNNRLKIGFSSAITDGGKITLLMKEYDFYKDESTGLINCFDGGTDTTGCLFKIQADSQDLFFNADEENRENRYIRCGNGRMNSKIITTVPYIDSDNIVDENYGVIVTDEYGQYINISDTQQVEIVDKYYAKIGVLNFFPVKDFDFDTVFSSYGEDTVMQNEVDKCENGADSDTDEGTDVTLNFQITVDDDSKIDDWDISYNKTLAADTFKAQNLPYGRFFYYNGDKINNEYDYFCENIIPELSTVNKTVPYIAKWCYTDDSKDSCENPYRLNGSKIFDACNMSANTFMKNCDIREYTHSMPYYVLNDIEDNLAFNEYQYIIYPSSIYSLESAKIKDAWVSMFEDTDTDNFAGLFGNVAGNKRFSRKYSRFLNGDSAIKASTLFRGVKFEIVDIVKGKEVCTSKYNNYRFSFIAIPMIRASKSNLGKIYFVKNDTFKFIVGMIFFGMPEKNYNKAMIYNSILGYLNIEDVQNLNDLSIYNIKSVINKDDRGADIDYNDPDCTYRISVADPDTVYTYDIFGIKPVTMIDNEKSVIGSVDISLKDDTNKLHLKYINRYSGYYNPIFKDILFYNDYFDNKTEECEYSNAIFNYGYEDAYGKFGWINNMWYHKVNENKSTKIFDSLTPYYPMIGKYALDYRDYNIFSGNWDKNYYTRQLDAYNKELCGNVPSMKNGLCMFGSKYLNVPEEIEIDEFNGGIDWNDDYITDTKGCDEEMMYKEVNNSSVNFYFFLHKRLVRFFKEMLKDEFEKYLNPSKSFGRLDTLDDDIEEYVEKNVLKLYELKSIRMFVKSQKMGVHNSQIENDYTDGLGKSVETLKSEGYKEGKNVTVSRVSTDAFDRKLVYNLQNNLKESFGFSFVIKKI